MQAFESTSPPSLTTVTFLPIFDDALISIGRQLPPYYLLHQFALINHRCCKAAQAVIKTSDVLRILVNGLTENVLSNLKGVLSLSLGVNYIASTDHKMINLNQLSGLRSLNLSGTQVSDKWLTNLNGLTQLRFLNLALTTVTDAGLPALVGLTNLISLNLMGTKITDAGIKPVSALSILRGLDLSFTGITDAALPIFPALTNLKELYLRDINLITKNGVLGLEKARPDLNVIHW